MTPFGCSDPLLQRMCPAFFEHVQEVLTECIRCGQLLTGLTHLLELPLLMSSELLWGKHKEPGGFLRRKPLARGRSHRKRARWSWASWRGRRKLLAPLCGDAFQ